MIDPALKGTINVLRSCAKVVSVKRVVLTSSMASVILTGKPLTPEALVDENWFSDPVWCQESKVLHLSLLVITLSSLFSTFFFFFKLPDFLLGVPSVEDFPLGLLFFTEHNAEYFFK